jgi:hypothetical protein
MPVTSQSKRTGRTREPVGSIHNPYPAHLWPHAKGTKLYFIRCGCAVGDGYRIEAGVVHWYNPGLVGSFVQSEGHPVFTMAGGILASADQVAPYTRAGRATLAAKIRARLLRDAESHEAAARRIRAHIPRVR